MHDTRRFVFAFATVVALGCNTADTQGVGPGGAADSGDCFFCLPDSGASPDAGDSSKEDVGTKPQDKGDGGTKPPSQKDGGTTSAAGVWHGRVDRSKRTGTYAFEIYDANKSVVCSVSYTVENLTDENTCTDCTFAHAFTLGAPTDSGDAACEGGRGQAGETMAFGHGPSAKGGLALFQRSGAGWTEKSGLTTVTGDTWDFFLIE